MADAVSRLYELRLASVGDARVRDAVLGVLGRWAPASATSAPALGRTGVLIRLSLRDEQAPELLRDLYAAGVAPAAVILRPIAVGALRDRADAAPAFALFTQNGGRFVPTWNWKAFVFGPLWYLRRGLYAKGVVLFVLGVCPFFTLTVTVLLGGAVLVYCGVAGNWDDYLWRAKGTQWW